MEAQLLHQAIPCRCGGQAKIFGPSEYAPMSHWGIYCSRNSCDKMASGNTLEEAVEGWNEEQIIVVY